MLVEGHSQREVGRTLHMSAHTVAKVIKTEDFVDHIKQMQERLFAIAPDALASFHAQVKMDGHLAYVFLKDLQIIPTRDALAQFVNAATPSSSETGFQRQCRLIASVLFEANQQMEVPLGSGNQNGVSKRLAGTPGDKTAAPLINTSTAIPINELCAAHPRIKSAGLGLGYRDAICRRNHECISTGHPLRAAHVSEVPRIHGHRDPNLGAWNRCEHRAVLGSQRRAAQSLALPRPDRLVSLYSRTPTFTQSSISYPNFIDWQHNNRSLASIAAYRSDDFNLTGVGEPERVRAEMISADFFSILGVTPTIGRDFTAQDDHAGAVPVVILSEGFWKQ